MKTCKLCKKQKDVTEFHKHKISKDGYCNECKICKHNLAVERHANMVTEKKIFNSAKSRASLKNRNFNIEICDIIIPKICPVLNIEIGSDFDSSPSIDRIDSTKGYVKGNIRIISRRANILKNNGTIEEFKLILKDLKKLQK
jgi:hypothetical protein